MLPHLLIVLLKRCFLEKVDHADLHKYYFCVFRQMAQILISSESLCVKHYRLLVLDRRSNRQGEMLIAQELFAEVMIANRVQEQEPSELLLVKVDALALCFLSKYRVVFPIRNVLVLVPVVRIAQFQSGAQYLLIHDVHSLCDIRNVLLFSFAQIFLQMLLEHLFLFEQLVQEVLVGGSDELREIEVLLQGLRIIYDACLVGPYSQDKS